jgi:hypothetical protein
MVFNFTNSQIRRHILLRNNLGGNPAFCIVHWNAPDFLLLTVNQIEFLYPDCKIYVLDNGSQPINIEAVEKGLKKFSNITLFVASPIKPNLTTRIGANRWLYNHTKGLQFLLNYAAEQQDDIAVFLDQDCILATRIDDLFAKLTRNVMLIGARDGRGTHLVHASFMILEPKRVNQHFGKYSIFHENTTSSEPYHGLSFKTKGKILFLECGQHNEIPLLTSYSHQNTVYAWHAWYSSRTTGTPTKMLLDGLSVSWLQIVNKQAFEYMKKVHEDTIDRSLSAKNE